MTDSTGMALGVLPSVRGRSNRGRRLFQVRLLNRKTAGGIVKGRKTQNQLRGRPEGYRGRPGGPHRSLGFSTEDTGKAAERPEQEVNGGRGTPGVRRLKAPAGSIVPARPAPEPTHRGFVVKSEPMTIRSGYRQPRFPSETGPSLGNGGTPPMTGAPMKILNRGKGSVASCGCSSPHPGIPIPPCPDTVQTAAVLPRQGGISGGASAETMGQ